MNLEKYDHNDFVEEDGVQENNDKLAALKQPAIMNAAKHFEHPAHDSWLPTTAKEAADWVPATARRSIVTHRRLLMVSGAGRIYARTRKYVNGQNSAAVLAFLLAVAVSSIHTRIRYNFSAARTTVWRLTDFEMHLNCLNEMEQEEDLPDDYAEDWAERPNNMPAPPAPAEQPGNGPAEEEEWKEVKDPGAKRSPYHKLHRAASRSRSGARRARERSRAKLKHKIYERGSEEVHDAQTHPWVVAIGQIEWPAQFVLPVQVRNNGQAEVVGTTICTGTILNANWILTASHCLGSPWHAYTVTAGAVCKPEKGGIRMDTAQVRRVKSWIKQTKGDNLIFDPTETFRQNGVVQAREKHTTVPEYEDMFERSNALTHEKWSERDVALLRLNSPLDLSGLEVKAIKMISHDECLQNGNDPWRWSIPGKKKRSWKQIHIDKKKEAAKDPPGPKTVRKVSHAVPKHITGFTVNMQGWGYKRHDEEDGNLDSLWLRSLKIPIPGGDYLSYKGQDQTYRRGRTNLDSTSYIASQLTPQPTIKAKSLLRDYEDKRTTVDGNYRFPQYIPMISRPHAPQTCKGDSGAGLIRHPPPKVVKSKANVDNQVHEESEEPEEELEPAVIGVHVEGWLVANERSESRAHPPGLQRPDLNDPEVEWPTGNVNDRCGWNDMQYSVNLCYHSKRIQTVLDQDGGH